MNDLKHLRQIVEQNTPISLYRTIFMEILGKCINTVYQIHMGNDTSFLYFDQFENLFC